MPVFTFIRGRDKQISQLLSQDTMTIIGNVAWADEDNGRYGVFRVDARGKLILDAAGNPEVVEHTGSIKVLRVVHPGDYKKI